MNRYTLIAGVNGTGKSSLRGVLEGQGTQLGYIIDPDMIARENGFDLVQAGKAAIREIESCLVRNISFTQETTLSGRRIERTMKQARKQGYEIVMYYVGLDTMEESLARIENRVKKGGHGIPPEDVKRRYAGRYEALRRVLPYCDAVVFYDNENGFVKVAEIAYNRFRYTNGHRPRWLLEMQKALGIGE